MIYFTWAATAGISLLSAFVNNNPAGAGGDQLTFEVEQGDFSVSVRPDIAPPHVKCVRLPP